MKYFLLTFFLLIFSCGLYAQKFTLSEGVNAFEQHNYKHALKIFEKHYEKGQRSVELYRYLALCYRELDDAESAVYWFSELLRKANGEVAPELMLFYTQQLRKVNRTNEADFWYKKFQEKLVESGQRNYHFLEYGAYLQVENEKNLNTSRSEFAPVLWQEGFVFVSNGKGLKRRPKKQRPTMSPFFDIFYSARKEDSTYSSPHLFSKQLTGRFNEGPLCFLPSGDRLIVTRNAPEIRKMKKKKSVHEARRVDLLKLYESVYDSAKGQWGKLQLIGVNDEMSSAAQATVSPSGKFLVFVSNRNGNPDLYISQNKKGEWQNPRLLNKEVNSSHREAFPYFISDTLLLFSSDRPGGQGALDFYLLYLADGQATNIKALGAPLNSVSDDFAAYMPAGRKMGYFSSNRSGGKGADDIYRFHYLPPDSVIVEGIAYNQETGQALSSVNLVFKTKGELRKTVRTNPHGKFAVWLSSIETYHIALNDEDFLPFQAKIQADNYFLGQKLFLPLQKKKYFLEGVVKSKANVFPVKGVKVTAQSTSNEQEIVTITDDDGNFKLELHPNQRYKIKVFKRGFLSRSKMITTFGNYYTDKLQVADFMLDEFEPGYTMRFKGIKFTSDNTKILDTQNHQLKELVRLLQENPSLKVEISIHSNSRGDQFSNLRKTYKQARTLMKYLINTEGIDLSKISVKGYGEKKLLNGCSDDTFCPDSEHAVNERIEVKILDL